MICKNLKTGKLFNYHFNEYNKVELDNGKGWNIGINYDDWCQEYLIIDKWRNLTPDDMKYNNDLDNGKVSGS